MAHGNASSTGGGAMATPACLATAWQARCLGAVARRRVSRRRARRRADGACHRGLEPKGLPLRRGDVFRPSPTPAPRPQPRADGERRGVVFRPSPTPAPRPLPPSPSAQAGSFASGVASASPHPTCHHRLCISSQLRLGCTQAAARGASSPPRVEGTTHGSYRRRSPRSCHPASCQPWAQGGIPRATIAAAVGRRRRALPPVQATAISTQPLAAGAKEAAWLGAARPRAAPEDQQAALLALVQPAERAMQEQAEGRRRISMQRNTNCALHATHRRLGALRRHAALLSAVRQPHCAKIRHAAAAIVEARSGLESSEEEEDQYGLVLVAASNSMRRPRTGGSSTRACAAHSTLSSPANYCQARRQRDAAAALGGDFLAAAPQASAGGILGAAPARLWQARIPAGNCLCRSRAGTTQQLPARLQPGVAGQKPAP